MLLKSSDIVTTFQINPFISQMIIVLESTKNDKNDKEMVCTSTSHAE